MNCQLTLDWRFQKKCFKNNIVVVFSRNMKNQIEELVNTKYFVKVIYPGTKYVVNYKKKERNQKCSLVYVGRLGVEKNVDFLIESYALCRNKNESVLTIVGDGGEMDNLKGLVSKLHLDNHVYFAGKQYDLEKYYSNSDYLIMPTIYEAFGFVIIEAQTFGIPVIGFKNNGKNIRTAVDEVVSNGDNGFVCNNYSKYDFATVMDKAIETYFTDNYSGMVEKSFVNAKNNYDWMLFLERLICFSSEKRE